MAKSLVFQLFHWIFNQSKAQSNYMQGSVAVALQSVKRCSRCIIAVSAELRTVRFRSYISYYLRENNFPRMVSRSYVTIQISPLNTGLTTFCRRTGLPVRLYHVLICSLLAIFDVQLWTGLFVNVTCKRVPPGWYLTVAGTPDKG